MKKQVKTFYNLYVNGDCLGSFRNYQDVLEEISVMVFEEIKIKAIKITDDPKKQAKEMAKEMIDKYPNHKLADKFKINK